MDLRRGIERGEGERERERGDKLKIELFEDSRRWWIFLGAFYGRMESNDRLGVKFFLRDLELESLRNTHFSYMRLCKEIYLLFSSIEKRETTNEIIKIMRFFLRILFSPTKSKLGGNKSKKAGETFNKLGKGREYCLTETGAVCKVSDRDRLIADNRRCFQVAVLFRVFPMEWSVSRLRAKCSKNFCSWGGTFFSLFCDIGDHFNLLLSQQKIITLEGELYRRV